MGEFSKKELEALDYLAYIVVNEIYSLGQEYAYKSRLNFEFCSNDLERIEESKKKMEKIKSKIDKCSPSLSVFLIEFIKPIPEEYNHESFSIFMTKNFILEEYQELIIELAKLHPSELEELDLWYTNKVIKSLGYSSKPLKEYIKGVFNVNNYLVYKSFLDTPEKSFPEESASSNPYPRIFKDANAYTIFKNLLEEFRNTNENLANYSFVYHKMKYDGLIHFDLLDKTFTDMLLDFDINIDRIKSQKYIGKIAYRESIYSKAKQSI